MSESDLMTRVCRGVVEKEREGEMAWEVEGESRELGLEPAVKLVEERGKESMRSRRSVEGGGGGVAGGEGGEGGGDSLKRSSALKRHACSR
jgi:hypothetical protein